MSRIILFKILYNLKRVSDSYKKDETIMLNHFDSVRKYLNRYEVN